MSAQDVIDQIEALPPAERIQVFKKALHDLYPSAKKKFDLVLRQLETGNRIRKAQSNRRLKTLCKALRQERKPAKARQLKNQLIREFYHGDQAE